MSNDTTKSIKVTFVNIELTDEWAEFRMETAPRWFFVPHWMAHRWEFLTITKWVYLGSKAVNDER